MKKPDKFQAGVLCTVGAAIFCLALAKEPISKFIILPDFIYSIAFVIGTLMILWGFLGWFASVLTPPANRVLEIVHKKLNAKYICVFATQDDLPQLYDLYSEFFDDEVPSLNLMKSWVRQNRKAFALVYRVDNSSIKQKEQVLAGSFKVLPITQEAVQGLESEQLSGSTFEAKHIARNQKDAAAYYVGDVVATRRSARAFILASLNFACENALRKGLPIYARPLTEDGKRVMTKYNFVQANDGKSPPQIGKICKLMVGAVKFLKGRSQN